MTKKIFIILFLQSIALASLAQDISLTDTTITFKDPSGKILNQEEVLAITKSSFNMKKETLPNGRTAVTIIPVSSEDIAARADAMAKLKEGLLNHSLQAFEFTDLKGNKLSKKDLAGKIIVMNFWFVNCKPCVMEMPLLNELIEEYKDKNVVFIAPALDDSEAIQKLLEKQPFNYSIIPNAKDYAKALGIRAYPTHLIVDAEGIIKNVFIGYNDHIKTEVGDGINKALASAK